MDPIRVPAPAPNAFNKHRSPSDLLMSQLKYFQHLDEKHDHGISPAVARDVGTEAGAARYIAAMTHSIRERALKDRKGTTARGKKLVVIPPPAAAPAEGGLAIAASGEETTPSQKGASSKARPRRNKP